MLKTLEDEMYKVLGLIVKLRSDIFSKKLFFNKK